MYKFIHCIVTNKYLNLILALVLIYSGLNEAWDTLIEDLGKFDLKGHHGIIILGFVHFFKAIEEIVKGLEKIEESNETEHK